jgi:adenine-specific DNA-methyltransferase
MKPFLRKSDNVGIGIPSEFYQISNRKSSVSGRESRIARLFVRRGDAANISSRGKRITVWIPIRKADMGPISDAGGLRGFLRRMIELGISFRIRGELQMPTLNWIGKEAVVEHHKEVPFRLLKEKPELSFGEGDSGNMLIQGDNLEALKALLPYYKGKVKCIYIDPPYNTGNENWVYNDNVNSPEMRNWLGKVVGRDDLSRHDKWLCMMYPRLCFLKKLLSEDGSLWISIDDNTAHYLKVIMDEIFGRGCFISTIVWQKRYSRENRSAIGDAHEYIFVYAINPNLFKITRNRSPLNVKSASVYKNPNNDPKGRWRGIPMNAQGYRPNQMYPIETPSGKTVYPPKGRCWSLIEPEFNKLLRSGRIWFGKKGDSQPNIIRYLSEVEGLVPWTWWPHDEVGHTDEAKKEMHKFSSKDEAFDTPKPERLLQRIIAISSEENEIILDCFAGSDTAGAVAQKMRRKWIMVEQEVFCETLVANRLKLVSNGKDEGGISKDSEWMGGSGFRFFQLGETIFDANGQIRKTIKFSELARFVFFAETQTPLLIDSTGDSPLLGIRDNLAVYLLYNGILNDKSPHGGNALTRNVLASLPPFDGHKVIYGTSCRLSPDTLKKERITFKQIPYQLKVDG